MIIYVGYVKGLQEELDRLIRNYGNCNIYRLAQLRKAV